MEMGFVPKVGKNEPVSFLIPKPVKIPSLKAKTRILWRILLIISNKVTSHQALSLIKEKVMNKQIP